MTLIQKIASLTPEQREKLGAVKDEAALNAFATENGIELTEQDKKDALAYFENGVIPMSDDDMDAVAGGGKGGNPEAEAKAKADGRTYNLPAGNRLCSCPHANQWSRSRTYVCDQTTCGTRYSIYSYDDIKCYKCNKTWASKQLVV